MICKKTGQPCQTPSMCSPFGGCASSENDRIAALEKRVAELEKFRDRSFYPQTNPSPYAPLYPIPGSAGDAACLLCGCHHGGLQCPKLVPMSLQVIGNSP